PQQASVPSALSPQVCSPPALTWLKAPAGGVAWPLSLLPQQASVPSAFTPQVWLPPALTKTGSAVARGAAAGNRLFGAKAASAGRAGAPGAASARVRSARRAARSPLGTFPTLPVPLPRAVPPPEEPLGE